LNEITRICWLVGWLFRSFVNFVRYARCDFSKTASLVFVKFGSDVEHHKRKT